ncbi:MAG: HlyD family efflux transporter periplasmic adaptor subunit [Lachnospiraceae bacterium]|nr:HlyD family efflux transporter periplasmic adaptor subunit [Lachnospiraceae bacterium]
MKPIIIDMKNLSESTEIYEKKPNPAIVGFVYVLLGITIISLLWMTVSKIDEVTECDGVILDTGDRVAVNCDYNARITKVCVSDGQRVQSGDALLELESLSNDNGMNDDYEKLRKAQEHLAILKVYNGFLNGDAVTMEELDAAQLDAMKDNLFFEEFQIRKKLFLLQLEEVKTDKITFARSVLNEKSSVQKELQTLEEEYRELTQGIAAEDFVNGKFVIRAKDDGYFYASDKLETGGILYADSQVGQIYPEQQKTFQAQAIVLNTDIGKIREGQEVKFEIGAFPSTEYGTLTGRICKIAKEAEFDQNSGMSYFPVWIDCDATTLTNKKGETISLMSGLFCQVKIVTDRKSVLQYVLESIN